MDIKLVQWNVNGWNPSNQLLREQVLLKLKPDIVLLNETHSPNGLIKIENYKVVELKRPRLKGSTRGYGGVAIALHTAFLEGKRLQIVSNDYDGILGICLEFDDIKLYIYVVYLPPENSNYGCDATGFFNHLLGEVYRYSGEHMIIMGDLNAKIGKQQDIILDNPGIKARTGYDEVVNSHGKSLLEFLNEGKLTVVNGRIGSCEATSVTSKGKSHIDYMIVPYDDFWNVRNFDIIDTENCITKLDLQKLVGKHSKPPDHNIISARYRIDYEIDKWHIDQIENDQTVNLPKTKKFNRKLKESYMKDASTRQELLELINKIENVRSTQLKVDEPYDQLVDIIMDENESVNVSQKRKFTPYKPYWDKELGAAWHKMNDVRKSYRKTHDKGIKSKYNFTRKEFNKMLRRKKSKYTEKLLDTIAKINTKQPTLFWEYVKSLGPRRKEKIDL